MPEKKDSPISTEDQKPVFVDIENSKEIIDHSKVYELPSIRTRYISTFIDLIFIVLATFGIATLLDKFENVPDSIRGVLFVFIVFLYEPIFTTIGCTIGQLIMDIRVRKFKNPEKKIYFHEALFRILLKWVLGGISFILIIFSVNKRAIHDFGSGSIVITPKAV